VTIKGLVIMEIVVTKEKVVTMDQVMGVVTIEGYSPG